MLPSEVNYGLMSEKVSREGLPGACHQFERQGQRGRANGILETDCFALFHPPVVRQSRLHTDGVMDTVVGRDTLDTDQLRAPAPMPPTAVMPTVVVAESSLPKNQ